MTHVEILVPTHLSVITTADLHDDQLEWEFNSTSSSHQEIILMSVTQAETLVEQELMVREFYYLVCGLKH
jgi:hypothetical protein